MKLFRIYCWVTKHKLETVPDECFKEEYNLPNGVISACVCLRCGKVFVKATKYNKAEVDQKKEKIKKIFGDYLYSPHKQRGARCPLPWDAPRPSIPDADEF